MAWRNPSLSSFHVLRILGVSAVSSKNGSTTAGPLDFLLDSRVGDAQVMATTATDHWLQIDRGTGTGPETVAQLDRLYLGANHNYDGENIRLRASTNAAVDAGVDILVPETPITGSDQIDILFTAPSTKRYITLDWPNSTSTAWETTEFWCSKFVEFEVGPDDGWIDSEVYTGVEQFTSSAIRTFLETGPALRTFEFDYNNVGLADPQDLVDFEEWVADVGLAKPFLFDPPFTGEDVRIMVFSVAPRRNYTYRPATSGIQVYSYRLRMVDSIG